MNVGDVVIVGKYTGIVVRFIGSDIVVKTDGGERQFIASAAKVVA